MIVAIKGVPNRAFHPWHRKETDKLQLATQNARHSLHHAFVVFQIERILSLTVTVPS